MMQPSLFHNGSLKDHNNYGKWIGGCGKYFMFSKEKANWTMAHQKCCSIGLTLAAIPTMGKKTCLDKIIGEQSDGIEDDFWLYSTDHGCSAGNMHWCSNFRPFQPKEVTWAPGEPSDKGSCVYMKSSNSSSLATANCSTEMRFLCDVRKKGTEGMALQQECLETWAVTPEELDLVTNTSVDIETLGQHVKCFIKCIGEFAGMFAMGGLNGGTVLRMIEEAANDDPVVLQDGFNAYDECSNIKYDDECVTASEIYSCGREKEPGIVDIMFNAEKGNATMYDPPLPCIPFPRIPCQFTNKAPSCVLNTVLKDELMQTNKTSMGNLVYMTNMDKLAFLSNSSSEITFETAWAYCCSIGMKLIEFPDGNYAEMNAKLTKGRGSIAEQSTFLYIGEMEAFNATHERWCQSKQLIKIFPLSGNIVLANTCTKTFLYVLKAFFYIMMLTEPR